MTSHDNNFGSGIVPLLHEYCSLLGILTAKINTKGTTYKSLGAPPSNVSIQGNKHGTPIG